MKLLRKPVSKNKKILQRKYNMKKYLIDKQSYVRISFFGQIKHNSDLVGFGELK